MIGPRSSRDARAQTSIDFVIAMGVFMIAVGFVLTFLPNIFDPFTGSSSANMVIADRTATQLTTGMLGSSTAPSVLNATCTAEFFDDATTDGCGYGSEGLAHELGVVDPTNVNVTVENVTDAGDKEIHDLTTDGGTVRLAAGSTPTKTQDITVARRMVLLDGEQYRLYVRVW